MEDSKKLEILYEGFLYDVTEFVHRHPGGNVIRFYTEPGEDATLAVDQFHHRSINQVKLMMKSLPKRPAAEKGEEVKVDKRYKELTKDFQQLHKELVDEGYFKPSYIHVAYRLLEIHLLAGLALYLRFAYPSSILIQVLSVSILGIVGGRSGWYMHEGGHYSLTGKPKIDRFLQSYVMGLGAGFSGAWWRSMHNRHHAMPQRLKHDVDLETMPLLAFNTKVLRNRSKDSNFFVRNQAKLFFIVDALLVTLLWKLYLCPRYAWKKGAYLDLFFMLVNVIVGVPWTTMPWLYLIAMWVGGNYMMSQFTLSHTHLPVAEEPRHWIEYSLCHTADIEPSWWCDWLMGYLNYQIEHHLFPTMPQFRQRLIKDRVKELAEKHNLPYITMSYSEAFRATFKNLEEVSKELKMM